MILNCLNQMDSWFKKAMFNEKYVQELIVEHLNSWNENSRWSFEMRLKIRKFVRKIGNLIKENKKSKFEAVVN